MKNEEEDKKWIGEYPMLEQVNPVNAFTVPPGYFAEMEEQVMGTIRLEQIKELSANDGFAIPVNYFDELTQNIESRVAIDKVLSNDNTFKVPESYFDDLSQNITSRIAIEEVLKTEKAFEVPENYFEELSSNILSRIKVEEALTAEQAFTVPDGYFANLESRILAQTTASETTQQADKEQRQGIIVKLLVSKAFKYASAACFALVVGSAVYMSEFNNPTAAHNRSFLHKEVSKMTTDELELYLQLNSDNSTILDNVSVDDEAALQDIKAAGKDN